jgi:hypothetical protein
MEANKNFIRIASTFDAFRGSESTVGVAWVCVGLRGGWIKPEDQESKTPKAGVGVWGYHDRWDFPREPIGSGR